MIFLITVFFCSFRIFLPSLHSFYRVLQSSALLAGHTRQFVRGSGASPTVTSNPDDNCQRIPAITGRELNPCTLS